MTKNLSEFDSVEKSRKTGASGRKGLFLSNLFSGLAVCGYCQSPLHFINKGARPHGGTSLACAQSLKGICLSGRWSYPDFERIVIGVLDDLDLKELFESDQAISSRETLRQQIELLSGELLDLEASKQAYLDLAEAHGVKLATVAERLRQTEYQIDEKSKLLQQTRHQFDKKLQARATANEQLEITELVARSRSRSSRNYKIRSQISNRLKSVVDRIYVYSNGSKSAPCPLRSIGQDEHARAIIKKLRQFIPQGHPTIIIALKCGDCLLVSPQVAEPKLIRLYGEGAGLTANKSFADLIFRMT